MFLFSVGDFFPITCLCKGTLISERQLSQFVGLLLSDLTLSEFATAPGLLLFDVLWHMLTSVA